MKKFVVIGLGNFGLTLARSLTANGCEVLGIDIDKEVVERAKESASYAVISDATKREALEALSISDFNGAIVSLGEDMALSTLAALYLKDMGIPKIIVRAVSNDHGAILKKIGVSEVIFPEKEIAIKLADRLSLKNALDYLPISEDYGILEVAPPRSFIGQSLKDLQIGSKYHCQVIGLKTTWADKNGSPEIKIAPVASEIIKENSIMIIIGKYSDIERIQGLE